MSISVKNTFIALTLAMATFAGTTNSNAANRTDPSQTRINQRVAANQAEYHRCAKFSIRVYNACLDQARGRSFQVRSCRASYQGNLSRCRALR